MRPHAFTVANYRAFVDETTLELRPLTLIFGQNNSGKSALLRLLPWIADSVSPQSRGPLDLNSRAIRGASFAEVHTRPPLSSRPELDLALLWDGGPGTSYRLRFRSFPELRRTMVRSFELRHEGRTLHGELDPSFEPGDEFTRFNPLRSDANPTAAGISLRFEGLQPFAPAGGIAGFDQDLESMRGLLTGFAESVQWLGSIRSLPEREVAFWGEPPTLISPEGRGTIELLVADQLRDRVLFPRVSEWFERYLGARLDLEPRSDRFAVVLSPSTEPTLRVNLLDTGEGITQVLPVLVAIERARLEHSSRRVLALEQPELHLHPAAQRALGDHLCEVAAEKNPPALVIETHSENVLLSVQLAVVQGRLPRDRVAIYWIRRFPDGRSRAELLDLDDQGHPQGWPPEVFKERLAQSRELVGARLAHDRR